MDSILLEHKQYGNKILIFNYEDKALDFFRGNIFQEDQDYNKISTIGDKKNGLGIIDCIIDHSITIVLMDIFSGERDLEKSLKLLEIIKKLSKKTIIIICSEVSEREINEYIQELNKDQVYYFDKLKVEANPEEFKETIKSMIEKFNGDILYINDRWILKTLNQASGFESFNLKFRSFWPLIKNEINLFEDSEYSIWFDKIYDEIIEKRFGKIFDTSGLKYIITAMKNLKRLERLSYITRFYSREKRYRDHFLHQVRIAVLGDFFLDVYLDEKTKVIDYINSILTNRAHYYKFADFDNRPHESAVKKCRITWWVTALMHDYTYPLYLIFYPFLFDENNKVEMLKSYMPEFIDPFLNSYKSTIDEFGKEFKKRLSRFLDTVKIDKRLKELILKHVIHNIGHNITGAFNLWHLQKQEKEKNEDLCTELACQSILLHHPFSEIGAIESKSISFDEYPLAFLLILLDEIQDWGRPMILTENQKDPTKIEKTIDLNEIEMEGLSKKKGHSDTWLFRDEEIIITMDYSKSRHIEPDLEKIIDSKEKNLNRLQIGGKLPNILIRIKFKDSSYDIPIERRIK